MNAPVRSGNRDGGQSREVERLATFPRNKGREEIRLSLDEYAPASGVPPSKYVSVRLWYRNESGEMRPTQKGTTIRRAELAKAIDALQRAAALIESAETKGMVPEGEVPF